MLFIMTDFSNITGSSPEIIKTVAPDYFCGIRAGQIQQSVMAT
jgi:hypothetical protein